MIIRDGETKKSGLKIHITLSQKNTQITDYQLFTIT